MLFSDCTFSYSYRAKNMVEIFKSDSPIGAENFHSDISQNNVIVGPYDSP